jgi:molybdopterin/thiamine biosynthesis adenylyltransferase
VVSSQEIKLQVPSDLWRQVVTVVKLTRKQRQKDDIEFGELLGRICSRQARCKTSECPISNYETLSSRTIENLIKKNPGTQYEFEDAPIIVGRKVVRDAIKARKIMLFAIDFNRKFICTMLGTSI